MDLWWLWLLAAIAVAIASLAFAGYFVLTHGFHFDFDIDLSDLDKTWTPEPFPGTGALPMSTKMTGSFVRWHNPELYWRGKDFWRTFQDGPWKWAEQQRYAGSGHNCGHYFALTQAGATAEAGFYKIDITKRRLLSAEFECDSILDLTYERHLVEMAKIAFSNWEKISSRHFLVSILSLLTDATKGGVPFTDFIGHWASRNGYDGILFFGARALNEHEEFKSYIETGADDGMAGPVVHGYFYEMRKKDDLKNLVIFSGAGLSAKIKATRLHPKPPDANPYFGASHADLDGVVEFKTEYQEQQEAKVMYLQHPFTLQ